MLLVRRLILVGIVLIAALPSAVHAAAQVALHQVNTSVGLKNDGTVATKWKLQTDPDIIGGYYSQFVPFSGSLSNTYDPTKLQLDVDSLGDYALGTTVVGLGDYEVTGFKVLLNDGNYVSVQEGTDGVTDNTYNSEGDLQDYTDDSGEAGTIFNIDFQLIADRVGDGELPPPLTADQDQFFYEIHLHATDGNNDNDPGLGSAFGMTGDFFTIIPAPGTTGLQAQTAGPGDIFPSFTPEPTSLSLLGAGILALLARRRGKYA